ncbi:MAG TPA: adenylate/guanylate cyclase domain-containing protein [Candidatus Limnocylindrales bacterium]|nr:adenylate/guanylate cyclase domain-containing protein [Candidatus Limnocylindrales bacterium]
MTPTDERRLVTVLFADLVGFTGRAESSDPEEVREMQRAYFAAVSAEVERYGGSVEKYIGDAVMAIFGAPQAHDDDAERALRAALRIREAVAGLASDLQVRIGVNTGEVVGGMGSGPQSGDYTVSGDAVNVAARLQQVAEPNEILVGGTARRLSAEAFAFAPLSELALKGRITGAEAWRLERELPERPRLRGGEARLVGRARESSTLESALEEAASGRGLIVALAGEAGIGKSRLALEMRQRAEADRFATVWTTSRSYATAFPYHLAGQLVQQLLAHAPGEDAASSLRSLGVPGDASTLERWAAVLDALDEEIEDDPRLADVSPAGRQRLLVQAVVALLRAVSQRQPLLVVFDDLHWADAASLAVVEELLDVVAELPVAMMALYRSGWSHGWDGKSCYQQLNLRALLPEEARELAMQCLPGGHLSDELVERVLERSAGNPFFLEELLRGEGQAATGPGHRLPETIHEMLLARLDTLPGDARQTLQLAAVVGMEFSEQIVSALATANGDGRDDATDDALRTLQRADLVVPRDGEGGERTLAFRHPLIHEVAYRSLLVSTRRALHGRIARWLEEHGGEELVAELAQHFRDSDDPEKARQYLPLAAERAERLNARSEARGWYLQAAEAFADEPMQRAQMLEAAARQTYLVATSKEAIVLQTEAIALYELAGAEVPALQARATIGRYHWLQGDPAASEREIGLAIAGLERLPPTPQLAYAYSSRSQYLMLRPDYRQGEAFARKAIAVGEATGATEALAHAYNNLGMCLNGQGDETGYDYLRRSLELSLEHGLTDDAGRAYVNAMGEGNRIFPFGYRAAEEFLDEALAFAQRTIPDGVFDHWIRAGHAEFLVVTGRWEEAERALDGVNGVKGGRYIEGEISVLRSQLASYRGRYDDAAALAAGKAEAALRIGDLQAVLPTFAALAHAQVGLGNDADAVSALRQAIDRPGSADDGTLGAWFLFEAVDLLTAARARTEEATDASATAPGVELVANFASALEPAVGIGGEAGVSAVREALFGAAVEQLGRLGAAVKLPDAGRFPDRGRALSTLDEHHRIFDAARIRLWLAEERGDQSLAADARATFEELGAHPYLGRAAAVR